jgi:catechol 2,3-dioxygenase-like lactoylglutathione lyase family enzyme
MCGNLKSAIANLQGIVMPMDDRMITGFDHLQLAMPPGGEAAARAFYGALLGLAEIPRPAPLAPRGGCWFAGPGLQLHLGVEEPFVPARKAHPAFLVRDLAALESRLAQAGVAIARDQSVPGVRRSYASDPFGNRLEFIQDGDGFRQTPGVAP